ncbi:MAG: hypothetical protein K6F57_01865 [Candidatus Saccharibacteria bacterium]|nr:hypothetical protein [Candidatus Saccharibacteria bacterium]
MEKLKQSRTLAPNLPEELYAVADYLSTYVPDDIDPDGLAMNAIRAFYDIKRGESSYRNGELPQILIDHRNEAMANMLGE